MRIAINGFGRIGRTVCRILANHPFIKIVAINDLMDSQTMYHLLKYDSIHGVYKGDIQLNENQLQIGSHQIELLHQANPVELPWSDLNIDLVLEATGFFKEYEKAELHLKAGAKKVLLSAPSPSSNVKTVVMGINDELLKANDLVFSNASCTTNSAAPMVKIVNDHWQIEQGYITTVHSYTTDQRLHDSPHKDLRRARAGALNIVPTTTGAAKAITRIFPDLDGRIGGCGIRVPVPDGSLTDITFLIKKDTNREEVNEVFQSYADSSMSGILQIAHEPLVSTDIVGNPYSCIFDAELTSVMGSMLKIVGWYDNETGYSNRLKELIEKVAKFQN